MALDREQVLLDNLRACLAQHERALVWGASASFTLLLLSIELREATPSTVDAGYVQLSAGGAWAAALALFFVFGVFGASSLGRAHRVLGRLKTIAEGTAPLDDILLLPSLATSEHGAVRLGVLLASMSAAIAGMVIEAVRESRQPGPHNGVFWVVIAMLIPVLPYVFMVWDLRRPFGGGMDRAGR